MKIVSFVCALPPYRAGIAAVAARQAALLARHNGVAATAVTMGDARLRTRATGGAVYVRLRPLWRSGLAGTLLPGVTALIRSHDIVHLHYPFFGSNEIVVLFAKLFRKKVVVTYHMDAHDPGWKRLLYGPYQRFVLPLVLRCADLCIATSFDYLRHSAAKKHFKRFPQRWAELPPSIDIQEFTPHPVSAETSAKYALPGNAEDSPFILMVGGLDRQHYFKGVHVLLEAFTLWSHRHPRWRLVIAGDGDLRGSYEERARALGLSDRVIFAGRVEQEMLSRLMRHCVFLTLPSLDSSEAFGIVLLEAMACGKPVSATRLYGVSTVVERADGGVLAPPNDVSALAASWDSLLNRLAQQPLWPKAIRAHTAEHYADDVVTARLLQLYRAL